MRKTVTRLGCLVAAAMLSSSLVVEAQFVRNAERTLRNEETSSVIPEKEKNALLSLYNQLDGANWKGSYSWNITESPSSWKGVTIEQGHVIKIQLNGARLKGELPASIADLTELRELWLSSNRLSGALPDALFTHKKLQTLVLDNQTIVKSATEVEYTLTGKLPSKIDMPELQTLSLGTCGLTGELPRDLNAPKLNFVVLSDNNFSGPIPEEWFLLPNLSMITFQDNNFSGELPDFTKAKKLSVCFFGFGQKQRGNPNLSGHFPKSFAGCPSLAQLEIQRTKVKGQIPKDVNLLKNTLTDLYLSDNQMDGVIPQELAECVKLKNLYLGNNQFVGPLPDLGSLVNLQVLELTKNEGIGGTIPTWLPKLKKLTTLRMAKMGLTGTLPKELAPDGNGNGIEKLFHLDFSHNQLEGEIPEEWKSFDKLSTLFLLENKLSGNPIPIILDWSQMNTLDISHNQFSGTIGSLFDGKHFESLGRCNISHNHFQGPITTQIYSQEAEPFFGFFPKGVNVSYNDFVFKDFANLTDAFSSSLVTDLCIYSPQNVYGEEKVLTLKEGEKLLLDGSLSDVPNVGHLKNFPENIPAKYQWYLNGKMIEGATKPIYEIAKVGADHKGVYVCKATHDLIPNLELVSREMLLAVETGLVDIASGDTQLRRDGDRLIYPSALHLYVYSMEGELVAEGVGETISVAQLPSDRYIVVIKKAEGDNEAVKCLL